MHGLTANTKQETAKQDTAKLSDVSLHSGPRRMSSASCHIRVRAALDIGQFQPFEVKEADHNAC